MRREGGGHSGKYTDPVRTTPGAFKGAAKAGVRAVTIAEGAEVTATGTSGTRAKAPEHQEPEPVA